MACKFGFFTAVLASILGTAWSEMEFELFAYGKVARPGLRLCYADGLAYIGGFPSSSEEMANITRKVRNRLVRMILTTAVSMAEDSDRFVARASSAGSDDPSWFSERTMFVDLTEGATSAVGFVADSERLPTGATTVGFGLYGGWAFHKQADTSLEMKFVAAPTNETGIYL